MTSPSSSLTLAFKDNVTVDDAEDAVRSADREVLPEEVLLDISRCQQVDTSAARIIANLLRRLADTASLATKVSTLPRFGVGHDALIRSLLHTNLGKAIATYSQRIAHGAKDVTDDYKERFLSETPSSDSTVVLLHDLHLPGAIELDDQAAFVSDFYSFLQRLDTTIVLAIQKLPGELIENIAIAAREAIQNVYDHAARAPTPPNARILSFFSIAMLSALNRRGIYGPFVKEINSRRGRSVDFLEIAISDNGCTIPSRHSQDANLHWKSVAREWEVFSEALERNQSIKLSTLDSIVRRQPGQGYPKIVDSVRKLGGYARLRTGGVTASLNSFIGTQKGFRIEQHYQGKSFGFVPGTLLEVLIPLPTRK